MQVIRFIFPFLFVRNWYDGRWELSRARCILFGLSLFLVLMGVALVYYLQAPLVYTAP